MDMIKWYVYFTGRGGVWRCHCFEDDEKQARHFASLVNGTVELEINGHKVIGAKKMNEYNVRIVLSELTIVAESQERAEEIAMEIYESDAHTKLHNGLSVECFEVDDLGPSDETEETVP